MDRVIDVDLVKITYEKDELGQDVELEAVGRPVVCSKHSISRQEWMAAAQQKLRPEFMLRLADSEDYEGEELAEVDGERYTIYRTYMTDDGGIELYMRKNVGDDL